MEIEPLDEKSLARYKYDAQTIDKALLQLAINGGHIEKTVRDLKAAGIKVTRDSVRNWRDNFPLRYRWHAQENARKLEDEIVAQQREIITAALEATRDAVELEVKRIAEGDVRDAAASGRNLATIAAIGTDKVLSLTGRPTNVVEHRKPEQIIKRLKELGYDVESTAAELPEDANA